MSRSVLKRIGKRGGWQPFTDQPPPTRAPTKSNDSYRSATPPAARLADAAVRLADARVKPIVDVRPEDAPGIPDIPEAPER